MREAHGPYRSLPDVVRRVALPLEAVEALILVGAVDQFGLGRREALWLAGLFVPRRRVGGDARERGRQPALPLPVEQDAVDLSQMTAWERIAEAHRLLGLSPHFHPLGLLRPKLPAGYATTADLEGLLDGAAVRLAGLVVCRQRPGTAKDSMFLLAEDGSGLVNAIAPRTLYERRRDVVRGASFVVLMGRLQKRRGVINLLVHAILPLEVARLLAELSPQETPEAARLEPAAHNYR